MTDLGLSRTIVCSFFGKQTTYVSLPPPTRPSGYHEEGAHLKIDVPLLRGVYSSLSIITL